MFSMAHEFQAVILADGPGSGLYPLVMDTPKSLLPLANKPMIYYQLQLLERSGISEVIVVCSEKYKVEISKYIMEVYSGQIKADIHPISDRVSVEGTADVLKLLRDKIKTDFFVIAGDVVVDMSLHELADVHRVYDASVTMLLKEHKDAHLRDERKKLRKLSKDVINYYGLVKDENSRSRHSRIVMAKSAALNDRVSISKHLFQREPSMTLHVNLIDGHIYLFRRSVLDVLCTDFGGKEVSGSSRKMGRKAWASLRTDFIPYLINTAQFKCTEDDESMSVREPLFSLAETMSSKHKESSNSKIKCFAVVLPDSTYCCRANSMYGYTSMNHNLASMPLSESTPWERSNTNASSKFKDTLVGEFSQIDKTANIKNCVIGAHCKIGAGVKLNNSVIMDHCCIGSDVQIQNSVLSSHCTVQDKCSLNEVQIAHGTRIGPASMRFENQALLASDFHSIR